MQNLYKQFKILNLKFSVYNKKFILCGLFFILLAFTSFGYAEPNFSISGIVVDNKTFEPLANVYIKQKDSLNSVLSSVDGKFKIELQKKYPKILIFEKEEFEPIEFEVKKSLKELKVQLSTINVYMPEVPLVENLNKPIPRILGNSFSAFYQVHQESYNYSSTSISGWGINELGILGQLKYNDWLFRFKGFKSRIPVNVADFPNQPAFYINTMQIKLGSGHVWEHNPNKLELGILGNLVYQSTSPDNKNGVDNKPIPYTNSLLDFGQTRILAGAEGILGWQINKSLSLSGAFGLYPGLTFYQDLDKLPDFNIMLELPITLKYEIISGLALNLEYSKQFLTNFSYVNDTNYLGFGVSIDPWRMSIE